MNEGIGKGKTREDHKAVSDQCYAAYAEGKDLRGLVAIVGKDALSERDRKFLDFADLFEKRIVRQGRDEDRDIETTLDLMWETAGHLRREAADQDRPKYIEKYHPAHKQTRRVTRCQRGSQADPVRAPRDQEEDQADPSPATRS